MEDTLRKKIWDIVLLLGLFFLLPLWIDRVYFILFPVFLGYFFAQAVRSGLLKSQKMKPGVHKILIVLLLLIVLAVLILLVTLVAEKALSALRLFSEDLVGKTDELLSLWGSLVAKTEAFFGRVFHRDLDGQLNAFVSAWIRDLAAKSAAKIPTVLGDLVNLLPRFFVSLLIFVFCAYYFSSEPQAAATALLLFFPKEKARRLVVWKNRFFGVLKRTLRAYSLIFLLTFSELFLGLTILRCSSAFASAFVIALVDILPVFGSGTVLIPWILGAFLTGNTGFAAGLAVLYAVIFIVRQFAEPKIVGRNIGLNPAFSLILMFLGLYFIGVSGMFLLPLGAVCVAESKKEEAKSVPNEKSTV